MENCYNLRGLIVDLSSDSAEEFDIDEAELSEKIGGAAYNLELYKKHESNDPFIIGTGPLTASFAPASCLGVATAKSPITGKVCHVPLTWFTAVELKLAGFDFVVITGSASEPKHLWIHDEVAEIEDEAEAAGDNLWQGVEALKQAHGDTNIKVISAGPAGMKGSNAARISENYWPARDTFGLGAVLGKKNLAAIAIRGLGYFETEQEVIEKCLELRQPILDGSLKGKTGPGVILDALGQAGQVASILEKYTHRNCACFHCPYPCQPYLMHNSDPTQMKFADVEDPGVLITSLPDLVSLSDKGDEAPALIMEAQKSGRNPMLEDEADQIPGWPGAEANIGQTVLSTAVHPGGDQALLRQALGYVTGVCPVFMAACPEMTADLLAEFLSAWSQEDYSAEQIESAAKSILE